MTAEDPSHHAPLGRRFSRIIGGPRIGARIFERRRLLVPGTARGIVDRIAAYAHPGLDPARVDPAIVAFFEDTASLELAIRSRWRFPMSVLWLVGRLAMLLIGQFVLPRRTGRVVTRIAAIDAGRDGRPAPRAAIRTYTGGGTFQAVAYATYRHYMSASFPLPGGQIGALLRLDAIPGGVALTSRRDGDEAGVWFVVGRLPIRSPLGERLALWPAGAPEAPRELADAPFAPMLVGQHEQRIFGWRFVTHDYWFRRLP